METNENNFLKLINSVYRECDGYESYGSTTEFFDEDGCVLMTATETDSGTTIFYFTETNENFEYSTMDHAA